MRCNSRHQSSTVTQCQASSLTYTITRLRQWITKKNRMATLVVILGLGGVFWVTNEAFVPQVTQAYTARVELSLDRQPNETYETLVSRAEAAARAAVQRSFDQDKQVTDVSIIIVGQNQGAIAPVLSLKVSRPQWLSRPDTQRWGTYFTNAQFLLRFKDLATTTPAQPETDPASVPEQPPNSTSGQSETETPASTPPEQPPNPTPPGQSETETPTSTPPEQPTNPTSGQPGTTSPVSTPPEQPVNTTPSQSGTNSPVSTPVQPTNTTPSQTGTDTSTTPSSQSPEPGSGLVPQSPVLAPGGVSPSDSQSPTLPNSVSPGDPSTSTPGASNPDATSVPNNSGNTPFGDNE